MGRAGHQVFMGHRRPIGARIGTQQFILPDNGLITPFLEDAEQAGQQVAIVHLNNPEYWLPDVSRTFHGRDIFAPTGAHLAHGVPLEALGDPISDPVRLDFSRPARTDNGWQAHITIIDVFGNLTTDLPAENLRNVETVTLKLKGFEIEGVVHSYGHRKPGELVALVDSEKYIEIAVVNGSAAQKTGAQIGDIVEVIVNA